MVPLGCSRVITPTPYTFHPQALQKVFHHLHLAANHWAEEVSLVGTRSIHSLFVDRTVYPPSLWDMAWEVCGPSPYPYPYPYLTPIPVKGYQRSCLRGKVVPCWAAHPATSGIR